MNRHRRRRLKLHLRAAPKQKALYRSSPKRHLKAILAGVFLALIMAGALGFAAVSLLKNARSKHQGHTAAASPSVTASALLAGSANPVPTTISSPPAAKASATPSIAKVPATPSPSPSAAPVSRPTALITAGTPREAKTPSEITRKSAEQRRRDAERKRARLETQYRSHEISDEAYKKGQQEYQAEMAKYRNVVNSAGSVN
jgi:type IV secretory pathway VirB10-like protein